MDKKDFKQKINVPAEVSELEQFIAILENLCEKCDIVFEKKTKVLISAEEIFTNIAFYAYSDKKKEKIEETEICFEYTSSDNIIKLTFTDSGVEYNPLAKEDPNINLDLENRTSGGLGIFMVKNMADNVEYKYKNKQNILCLTFQV